MGGRGDGAMRATLAGLVGPGAVTGGDQTTLVRVLPETTEQTAAVLAACSREGWRVWPAGRGSRRGPGPGPGPAVVLSTERLVGLTIYEPEDLTVGCRAGMRHGDLAAATAAHRQMLPLEPAAGTGATLGGTLALADAGPLRAGYGAPRDLALGVTVVTGDGRVLRFGGRVVKNVAGYDVVRLLVGSRGTLGVITELHVRLRGRPEHDVTLLLDAPDAATAAALALGIRDAAAPVALEVLADPPHPDRWQLAVRLHGSRAVVDDGRERIAGLGAALRALADGDVEDAARLSAPLAAARRAHGRDSRRTGERRTSDADRDVSQRRRYELPWAGLARGTALDELLLEPRRKDLHLYSSR